MEITSNRDEFSIFTEALVLTGIDADLDGNRPAQSIASSDRINTLQKSFLFIQNSGGNILVGNSENGFATITAADIEASNGVIHMIDRVLVP
jgi:uncharacterized surface protein with fasciclin (FAS1) repeats